MLRTAACAAALVAAVIVVPVAATAAARPAFFPAEQLFLLDSRDYFRSPTETLNLVVTGMLGLPSHGFAYKASRTEQRDYPKMREETKARLREFYWPYNEELFEYAGTDFGW